MAGGKLHIAMGRVDTGGRWYRVQMAEGVLRTAFARRDLMHVLAVVKPRSGPKSTTSALMAQQEVLGKVGIVTETEPDTLMSPSACGLNHTSESWSVAGRGRRRSQPVETYRESVGEGDGDIGIYRSVW